MNVLAIGAHHDDIEIGCGGTLARLVQQGDRVYGVVLTDSETHYDLRGIHRTTQTARLEASRAAEILGIELLDAGSICARNGELNYDVNAMRELENLLARLGIDLVLTHWQGDLNTDHAAAARLTIVAARHVGTVLSYRSNWYQPGPPFNGLVQSDISSTFSLKQQALACFEGEIKSRGQGWIDSFLDANRGLGHAAGVTAIEAFEPVRVAWTGRGLPG